jgi:hypothetical protein
MNAWITTNLWFRHWRKFIYRLKFDCLSGAERDLVERSACLANANYVMSLAEEKFYR